MAAYTSWPFSYQRRNNLILLTLNIRDFNFKLSWYNFEEKNAIYDLSAIILCSLTQKNFPVSNSYFLLWIYTCLNLSYFHYIIGNKIVARENYKNGENDMAERQRLKELSQGNSDQSGLSREERDRRATVWIKTKHTYSEEKLTINL